MVGQERSTQTERSSILSDQFYGLKSKDVLKFISSLLLPLALGIFTIVITFQQQNAAKQQRDEDRRAAELLREQERNLNDQRDQNERFDTYIQEIGKLLKEYNGSIISNEAAATLVRIKTLNVFRLLDSARCTRVIRFLYEAKQLVDTSDNYSLDLSTAKLTDIDFRDIAVDETQLHNVSLRGIFLSNATFTNINMQCANFSRTQFDMSDFVNINIFNTNFERSRFKNVNISRTHLDEVSFVSAELNNNVNFSLATVRNTDFTRSSLLNINFKSAAFINVKFISSSLQYVNFSSSQFYNVSFSSARLETVDFSFAIFYNVNFSGALLLNVNLSHTNFIDATFFAATIETVNWQFSELDGPNFEGAKLQNTNFYSATLISAKFDFAKASLTNFQKTNCVDASFMETVLTDATFWHSNVKRASFDRAKLEGANFSHANLYEAKFISTTITDKQLESALSVQDVLLPNTTRAKDKNLMNNGVANCNISHENGWTLQNGSVAVVQSNHYNSYCEFILQTVSTDATMYQRVSLSNKWDSTHWPNSLAVLRAHMGIGLSMELKGIDSHNQVIGRQTLILPNIPANARWKQNGFTIAGGKGFGSNTNQLKVLWDLFVDEDQTVVIADYLNNRIIQWKEGNTHGEVIAGGNGEGNGLNQFHSPNSVLIDKRTNSLIVSDQWNRRVVRWSRRNGTKKGEILLDNIGCFGLAMDDEKYLYVSNIEEHEVRRYRLGDKNGTLVAGGNGKGSGLNQLNQPKYIFVDRQQNLYVSGDGNNRVMKWNKGAKEGIVIIGGNSSGNAVTQLNNPQGIFVDTLGTLYVTDSGNHRVMRWSPGDKQGTTIVGWNGYGGAANQLRNPMGLFFDRYGNLYVADMGNNRAQRFDIIK